MSRNFNVKPYYDDFNDSANFHRILFKPGVSVQARELTQSQTILQDQISKFGNFVFKDGSKVTGGEITLSKDILSIRIQPILEFDSFIDSYVGYYVVGRDSGCIGRIHSYTTISESTSSTGSVPILFVKLIKGVKFLQGETLYIYTSKFEAISSIYSTQTSVNQFTVFNTVVKTKMCTGSALSYTITSKTDFNDISIGDYVTISGKVPIGTTVLEIIDSKTIRLSSSILNTLTDISNAGEEVEFTRECSRVLSEISVSDGVFFSNGIFVKFNSSTIIPSIYTDTPTVSIGLQVLETVVDYIDDESLLDPALGSYNYAAPGADRYKIHFTLTTQKITTTGLESGLETTSKYIELLRLSDGKITTIRDKSTLGELETVLNRRTYDESGNYSVIPNKIYFSQESRESDDYVYSKISPGKSYVLGKELENSYPISLSLKKGRDVAKYPKMNPYFGISYDKRGNVKDNFLSLDSESFVGSILDVNNKDYIIKMVGVHNSTANIILNSNTIVFSHSLPVKVRPNEQIYILGNHYTVELTSTNTSSGLTSANVTPAISSANANNVTTKIYSTVGSSVIRNIARQSSTDLYAYIYNTKFNDNYTIANVSSIQSNTFSSNVTSDGSQFNIDSSSSLIVDLGVKYIKPNVSSAQISFDSEILKSNITISTNGDGTAESGLITFDTNVLVDVDNAIIISKSYSGSNALFTQGTVISPSLYTISSQDNRTKAKIIFDDFTESSIIVDVIFNVNLSNQTPILKTLKIAYDVVNLNTSTSATLSYSDIKGLLCAVTLPSNVSLTSYSDSVTYNIGDVVYYHPTKSFYSCVSNTTLNKSPDTFYANWEILPDIKSKLSLDNGQTDLYYGFGTISVLNKYTNLKENLIAVLYEYYDWQSESPSQPSYSSAESYRNYAYSQIPSYTSKKTGITYRLGDCLDFRPRLTSLSDAGTFNTFSRFVTPNPSSYITSQYDYDIYLPRIDKLLLSQTGKFKLVTGIPSTTPKAPTDASGFMPIATISIPTYTYKDSDIIIKYSDNLRYTMSDIRNLDNRISTLEYYTSLSLLEQEAVTKVIENIGNTPKSGILVDSFIGHGIGDITNTDYSISVDSTSGSIKPPFHQMSLDFFVSEETTSDYKWITLPWTSEIHIENVKPTVSGHTKINPFNSFDYRGNLILTPDTDKISASQSPVVIISDENDERWVLAVKSSTTPITPAYTTSGSYTNSNGIKTQLGTVYGQWEETNRVHYAGSTAIKSERKSSSTSLKTASVKVSAALSFCRQIKVQFTATGLRPFTEMFLFCENKLIPNVKPYNNPFGMITVVNVLVRGQSYSNSTIVTIDGTHTAEANLIPILSSTGEIDHILILSPGRGYTLGNTNVIISDSTGSNAIATATTYPQTNDPLLTDSSGTITGEFIIPANTPIGKLKIDICSNPISPSLSGSYATATFTTEVDSDYGTLYKLENIITSPEQTEVQTVVIPDTITEPTTTTTTITTTTKTDPTPVDPVNCGDPTTTECKDGVSYVTSTCSDGSTRVTKFVGCDIPTTCETHCLDGGVKSVVCSDGTTTSTINLVDCPVSNTAPTCGEEYWKGCINYDYVLMYANEDCNSYSYADDRCAGPLPTTPKTVVDISNIALRTQTGTYVNGKADVSFTILDSNGKVLPSSLFTLADIKAAISSGLIQSSTPINLDSLTVSGNSFVFKVSAGDTPQTINISAHIGANVAGSTIPVYDDTTSKLVTSTKSSTETVTSTLTATPTMWDGQYATKYTATVILQPGETLEKVGAANGVVPNVTYKKNADGTTTATLVVKPGIVPVGWIGTANQPINIPYTVVTSSKTSTTVDVPVDKQDFGMGSDEVATPAISSIAYGNGGNPDDLTYVDMDNKLSQEATNAGTSALAVLEDAAKKSSDSTSSTTTNVDKTNVVITSPSGGVQVDNHSSDMENVFNIIDVSQDTEVSVGVNTQSTTLSSSDVKGAPTEMQADTNNNVTPTSSRPANIREGNIFWIAKTKRGGN